MYVIFQQQYLKHGQSQQKQIYQQAHPAALVFVVDPLPPHLSITPLNLHQSRKYSCQSCLFWDYSTNSEKQIKRLQVSLPWDHLALQYKFTLIYVSMQPNSTAQHNIPIISWYLSICVAFIDPHQKWGSVGCGNKCRWKLHQLELEAWDCDMCGDG